MTQHHDNTPAAALALAERGWPVLPCAAFGKSPLTEHGKDDASTDPGLIRAWWERWPNANVGVRPPDGVVVIDVDTRNGGGANLRALMAEHGALPATLTAQSGSGGVHLWYAAPGPFRGNLGGRDSGIDVKSSTGYLIAPPSVHPCGGHYRWVHPGPITPAPAWLRELLTPPVRPTRVCRPGGCGCPPC